MYLNVFLQDHVPMEITSMMLTTVSYDIQKFL